MWFKDRYDVINQIGRGTTASVFLVRDKHLDKKWATKVFEYKVKMDEGKMALIQNEIQILKMLNFSHMPRIVDLYQEPQHICVVMDYLEGVTLSSFIEQFGSVSEQMAVQWMKELCQLLGQLHQLEPPVIFCDLKPENLIVQGDGSLGLVDFGSARCLDNKVEKEQQLVGDKDNWQSRSILPLTGTREYTAPELFLNQIECMADKINKCEMSLNILSPQSDVYSIGAVGFFAVTGLNPKYARAVLVEKNSDKRLLSKSFRRVLECCFCDRTIRIKNCTQLLDMLKKVSSTI